MINIHYRKTSGSSNGSVSTWIGVVWGSVTMFYSHTLCIKTHYVQHIPLLCKSNISFCCVCKALICLVCSYGFVHNEIFHVYVGFSTDAHIWSSQRMRRRRKLRWFNRSSSRTCFEHHLRALHWQHDDLIIIYFWDWSEIWTLMITNAAVDHYFLRYDFITVHYIARLCCNLDYKSISCTLPVKSLEWLRFYVMLFKEF